MTKGDLGIRAHGRRRLRRWSKSDIWCWYQPKDGSQKFGYWGLDTIFFSYSLFQGPSASATVIKTLLRKGGIASNVATPSEKSPMLYTMLLLLICLSCVNGFFLNLLLLGLFNLPLELLVQAVETEC